MLVVAEAAAHAEVLPRLQCRLKATVALYKRPLVRTRF